MWFIGDIHGEFDWYLKKGLRGRVDCSVQLGDFGWGFEPVFNRRKKLIKKWSHMKDISYIPPMQQHRFICGNHDDRMLARQHPNYLGDFGFVSHPSLFYVSGGASKDRERRKVGVEWWEHEELSDAELEQFIDEYVTARPQIVVTHEAPQTALTAMFSFEKYKSESRTAVAMEKALAAWQPDYWYFGHYHYTKHLRVGKTCFQCVGEFQRVELRGVTWE